METRTYRNHIITKHDTGGQRIGRIVSFTATDATTGEVVAQSPLLRMVKEIIDCKLDATADDIAHRDAIMAMLTK